MLFTLVQLPVHYIVFVVSSSIPTQFVRLLDTWITVSYTHLDVYKRQNLYSSAKLCCWMVELLQVTPFL